MGGGGIVGKRERIKEELKGKEQSFRDAAWCGQTLRDIVHDLPSNLPADTLVVSLLLASRRFRH